ncbi:phasin family protein [Alkalilimnicola ehrlichii]|nr:phasin family protein [Alkalilimnicola ehrlichii]
MDAVMMPMRQWGDMMTPMRQFGSLMIDSMERFSDYQLEIVQSYTLYTMRQLREAMEVHDARSLREYLANQSRATEELGRKLAEDTQQLMSISQDVTNQGLRVIRSSAEKPSSTHKKRRKRQPSRLKVKTAAFPFRATTTSPPKRLSSVSITWTRTPSGNCSSTNASIRIVRR